VGDPKEERSKPLNGKFAAAPSPHRQSSITVTCELRDICVYDGNTATGVIRGDRKGDSDFRVSIGDCDCKRDGHAALDVFSPFPASVGA
jgi:hypothetical protein